jgi:hypothetical protein
LFIVQLRHFEKTAADIQINVINDHVTRTGLRPSLKNFLRNDQAGSYTPKVAKNSGFSFSSRFLCLRHLERKDVAFAADAKFSRTNMTVEGGAEPVTKIHVIAGTSPDPSGPQLGS